MIFKSIECGAAHSLFIDIDNNLYACGDNGYGQLCQNNKKIPNGKLCYPIILNNLPFGKVLKAKTGDAHVIIINDKNELWGWGHCEFGQLGFYPKNQNYINTPAKIHIPNMPVKIVAGSVYSFVVSSDRSVWGFGLNDYCQLGIETQDEHVFEPVLIDKLKDCDILSFKSGSNHSLCYTRTKKGYKLYGWGMNKHFQLALEGQDKSVIVELQHFNNAHLDYIAAGGYHSCIIMS